MKLASILAVLALLGACKKSDDKPAAGSAAATTAGATSAGDCSKVERAVDSMAGNGPMAGSAAEIPAKLKKILVTRCTEDKWPQAAIDCYANDVKDMMGMKRCRDLLGPEAGGKVIAEIRQVMMAATGGMMPPSHNTGGSSAQPAGTP